VTLEALRKLGGNSLELYQTRWEVREGFFRIEGGMLSASPSRDKHVLNIEIGLRDVKNATGIFWGGEREFRRMEVRGEGQRCLLEGSLLQR